MELVVGGRSFSSVSARAVLPLYTYAHTDGSIAVRGKVFFQGARHLARAAGNENVVSAHVQRCDIRAGLLQKRSHNLDRRVLRSQY